MDFFGGGGGAAGGIGSPPESVELVPKPSISAQEFQTGWAQWNAGAQTCTEALAGQDTVAAIHARGHRDFLSHVAQANISSFATPREGGPPPYRFLFLAQRSGTEVVVSASPPSAAVTVKSPDAAAAAHVRELLQTLLLTV